MRAPANIPGHAWFALGVLALANLLNYVGRYIFLFALPRVRAATPDSRLARAEAAGEIF